MNQLMVKLFGSLIKRENICFVLNAQFEPDETLYGLTAIHLSQQDSKTTCLSSDCVHVNLLERLSALR